MTPEEIRKGIPERAMQSVLAKTEMFKAATGLLLTLTDGVRLLIDQGKLELAKKKDGKI